MLKFYSEKTAVLSEMRTKHTNAVWTEGITTEC